MMDGFHFDPTIGLGSLITGILTVLGFALSMVVWKTKTEANLAKIGELEKKVAVIDTQIEDSRISLSELYVRKADIDKLENRIEKMISSMNDNISEKISAVKHQMNNLDQKIYSVATGRRVPPSQDQ